MKITKTAIEGVVIIEPDVYGDNRGFFMETYQKERYQNIISCKELVQDNLSFSAYGTLRGLHFQNPNLQAKLVQVIQGEVFDVAVDIRKDSPTFGQYVGVTLSGKNKRQFFLPEGFAHGFCVTSETAFFVYKCSDYYAPENEGGVLWNDPDIGIEWPVDAPTLSEKDSKLPRLRDISVDRLPTYVAGNR